jgi:putative toxin-antitoxin system antitoxin component (TIGR02293 family)
LVNQLTTSGTTVATIAKQVPIRKKAFTINLDAENSGRAYVPKIFKKEKAHSKTSYGSIFIVAKMDLWDQTVTVRKGLPAASVDEMSDALSMPRANLLDYLQLARSTIEGRIKKSTPLTPAEGDAVLRTAKALTRAQEVFEDADAASSWLKRETRSLGGVTPVSLMDTVSGFELVMNTLGRIEQGVVA